MPLSRYVCPCRRAACGCMPLVRYTVTGPVPPVSVQLRNPYTLRGRFTNRSKRLEVVVLIGLPGSGKSTNGVQTKRGKA